MKIKTNSGFTLIEILIVVAIIATLASVVLVGLGSFRGRGRDTRRISDLRQIQSALELYYAKNQTYPDFPVNFSDPSTSGWLAFSNALITAGIGVSNLSNDPLKSQSYAYGTNGQSYVLGAKLEDENSSALKDSVKGGGNDTFGVDCSGSVYCIKL
ncbi:type II secretion system protein [Candidatus Wolfebacteria bacterium]|nr:type II secretion system protein [Candidatus Wolfebacteria bacterium]